MPKNVKRLCKKCKKHTEHTVKNQTSKGLSSKHTQSRGSKTRVRKRGLRRGAGNLGRFSKGALGSWKRYGKKTTKKSDLRYTCKECKKTSVQKQGFRAKKIEFK